MFVLIKELHELLPYMQSSSCDYLSALHNTVWSEFIFLLKSISKGSYPFYFFNKYKFHEAVSISDSLLKVQVSYEAVGISESFFYSHRYK
jgi:hypothetical protein